MSCLVENFIPTVSLGFSSVYNLRPLPFGFLPVPFLGSSFNGVSGSVALGVDFRVLSVDLLLSMFNIFLKSMSSKFSGNMFLKPSISVLNSFLANVPDTPPVVDTSTGITLSLYFFTNSDRCLTSI